MSISEDEHFEDGVSPELEHKAPKEGDFDLQLTLPLEPMPSREPISRIKKRDGRQEAFDKQKIGEAIFKAAESIGGQDRNLADSLASAVTIYLTKRLGGATPTVDQVHDAVERVLIQMDHFRTALAYVRYRDQRARIRKLREGDLRILMQELDEARSVASEGRSHALDLAVQTSSDTLVQWDRARIVEALCLETDLDRKVAEQIAVEVEHQLQQAQIKTLTTSLVRELVDARLIAHGLESYRERHRRLGVPIYDLEQILRGTHRAMLQEGMDPEKTDRILAGALKKEYALAQVFSARIVEAHLQGILHLHDLERIDRLDSATFFTEALMRCGFPMAQSDPVQADFTEAPTDAMDWLAHWSMSSNLLGHCFSGNLGWEAFNVVSATYLQGWSGKDIEGFARSLVYECTLQTLKAPPSQRRPQSIRIFWRMPQALRERGLPGNLPPVTSYADCQHTAQELAWALLDVFKQGGRSGIPYPAPRLEIVLDDAFFKADGHAAFLRHAASVATQRGNILFRLERDADPNVERHPPDTHRSIYGRVTLNLPRIAYEAESEAHLWQLLETRVALAATALQEKHDFLAGLFVSQGHGALRLLQQQIAGAPWVDLEHSVGVINIEGLWDCIRLITQPSAAPNELQLGSAISMGERILQQMQACCHKQSLRYGIKLALSQGPDNDAGRRFTELDLRAYPKSAQQLLRGCIESREDGAHAVRYTPGATIHTNSVLDTYQHVQLEGYWHPYLSQEVYSIVPLPMQDTSEQTVVDFLKKVYYHTGTRALFFA